MPSLKTLRYINNNGDLYTWFPMGEVPCLPPRANDEIQYETKIRELIHEEPIRYNDFWNNNEHIVEAIKRSPKLRKVSFENMCMRNQIMTALAKRDLTELKLINVKMYHYLGNIHKNFQNLTHLFLCNDRPHLYNYYPNDAITELTLNNICKLRHLKTLHLSIIRRVPQLDNLQYYTQVKEVTIHMRTSHCWQRTIKIMSDFVLRGALQKIHLITSQSNRMPDHSDTIKTIKDMINEINDEKEVITHKHVNSFDQQICC